VPSKRSGDFARRNRPPEQIALHFRAADFARGAPGRAALPPAYCPHLDPVERLMHKRAAHNKCHATSKEFADATLGFLREKVPKNWPDFCRSITANFRVV
jgi:hypothetical protein